MRIGNGFDVHQLVPDRPLILGGITIPHHLGLLGHSDADVLTHAIMDALLGALALGTIGDHFPDTDPHFKNANSLGLLQQVYTLMRQNQYAIGNIDTVIVAQKPKLQPYILAIRTQLAETLSLSLSQISVKATTSETLGFEGQELGISAHAVVLLTPER